MIRARVVVLVLLTSACDGTYRIVMPYCPVSDSAKKHADSIPVFCAYKPDTSTKKP